MGQDLQKFHVNESHEMSSIGHGNHWIQQHQLIMEIHITKRTVTRPAVMPGVFLTLRRAISDKHSVEQGRVNNHCLSLSVTVTATLKLQPNPTTTHQTA